ncbi:zonular occludens toxin domain-containing protein [Anaeromicropila populeti]|uniref:Zonular occludens toxin (Zot) n=1 Tax=Anaeromicropila populeti TaxID=37658 RepID=A0A1I6L161_9FIRM|nr:zonular occludens toxin domain-containing protein [Anaeromicropila populeti]SFR97185.1 Zonular occludens toxin (Zot) [Anaeromicropila populeti]
MIMLLFTLLFCVIGNIIPIVFYSFKDVVKAIKEREWRKFKKKGIDVELGYFGKGKTLTAVWKTYKIWKKYKGNVEIVSNIPLNFPYTPFSDWGQLTSAHMKDMDDYHGTVFLLDEGSELFDSRDFKTFPKEIIASITQCRKSNIYFLITFPEWNDVDVKIRRYVRNAYLCRKLWRFQWEVSYNAKELERKQGDIEICEPKKFMTSCRFVLDRNRNLYNTRNKVRKGNIKREKCV